MEPFIGLLLIGGTLYTWVALHRDARAEGWCWPAQIVLYASGIALLVLGLLITLGSTEAARIMFVGIGAVLIVILLLVVGLLAALGIAALRQRKPDSDPGDQRPPDDSGPQGL